MRKELDRHGGIVDTHNNHACRCSHSHISHSHGLRHCAIPETPIEYPARALFRSRVRNKACINPRRRVKNRPGTNGGPRRIRRLPRRVPPACSNATATISALFATPDPCAAAIRDPMTPRRAHSTGCPSLLSSGPTQRRNCLGLKRSRHRMAAATTDADDQSPFFPMLAGITPPDFARLLQGCGARRLSDVRDKRNNSRCDPVVVAARLAADQIGQSRCRPTTGPGGVWS
ncbi:hypothetical protein Mycsm_05785 [Mycobacterium sp. JS623]|nr:hypothetical protein Mycsm_05785 [Mycobacterium sp. JS623]